MARHPDHDILFEPIRIGPRTLRNRFLQTPHTTGFGVEEPGSAARYRATRAEGGWGAVNVEICSIDPEADRAPLPVPARIWDDDDVRNLRHVCEAVHEHGALAGVELWHGGANVDASPSRHVPGAPSVLPSDAFPLTYPRELTEAEIATLVRRYAEAAGRAVEAGFDIVYAYGAHGYLPGQFLSPFYNRRSDRYGGSLENRARFWLEVLEAVRAAVDGRCAIAVRIGIDPSERTGVGIDAALGFVRMADPLVDLWDVNTSAITEPWLDMRPSRLAPQGYQFEVTSRVREATAKPIVGVSRLTDPDRMAEIVRSGGWDIIGAARPSIADAFLPRKIEDGRLEDIRECIGCNICLARTFSNNQISCTQDPTAGEEYRRGWHPERVARIATPDLDVLVVGAGVAGMQCALTLARRGAARVRLVDAQHHLGGYAELASRLPGLGEWRRLVTYRETQLRKLPSVEIATGVRLSAEEILERGAGVVVLATGASWAADGTDHATHAPVPGVETAVTLTPEQVLAGEPAGDRVLVYDAEGYFMGAGMAELLALAGHRVTFASPLPVVAPYLDKTFEGDPTRRKLAGLGVDMRAGTRLMQLDGARCRLQRLGVDEELEVDTVVLVTSRRPRDELRRVLLADPAASADAGIRAIHAIGDCLAPRLLADCVFDGHRLAMEIDAPDPAWPKPFRRERRVAERARAA